MKIKIWSEGHEKFVCLEVSDKQFCDAREFIEEHKNGDFFDASSFHTIFTEEQNDEVETGTVAFVAAFLPDGCGLGVTQHGCDDFAIEPTDYHNDQ